MVYMTEEMIIEPEINGDSENAALITEKAQRSKTETKTTIYVSDKRSTVGIDDRQRTKRRQQHHHTHMLKKSFCASTFRACYGEWLLLRQSYQRRYAP